MRCGKARNFSDQVVMDERDQCLAIVAQEALGLPVHAANGKRRGKQSGFLGGCRGAIGSKSRIYIRTERCEFRN